MSDYPPLIFIAVCSGEKKLVKQWAASGDLPNIARLLGTGYTVDTESLHGLYVGANWPSLQTACHPGKNRVFSWEQLQPGTYNMYRCKASDQARRPPFWEKLSEAGKKICIFDIPHSGLSKNLNGLQTVEWGAHDAEYGFRANSQQLHDEIIEKFGLHPVPGNSDADRSKDELLSFCEDLQHGAKLKGRFSRYFLEQQQPDFFAQVFTEAHCGGHLLWHLHDPNYQWHRGARSPDEIDSLKLVYQAVDEGIGEMLQAAPANANIFLLFSHGMGPMHNPYFMTEEILLALGVAEEITDPEPTQNFRNRIDPVLTWAWQQIPSRIKKLLQPLRKNLRDWVVGDKTPPSRIDKAKSRVFSIDKNHAHAGLRINLVGREPEGKVMPGEEYQQLLDQLTVDFKLLINQETGKALVEEIYRTDKLYDGPERAHLPDLLVSWRNDDLPRQIYSPKIGHLEKHYEYVRSGDHSPYGMFVLNGPGIPTGHLQRTVSILDIAPTLCSMQGVELLNVDGKSIAEVVGLVNAASENRSLAT